MKNNQVELINPDSLDTPLAIMKILVKNYKYKEHFPNITYSPEVKKIFNDHKNYIDYIYENQIKIYNKEYFTKTDLENFLDYK